MKEKFELMDVEIIVFADNEAFINENPRDNTETND